jgi:hypothetical protein
MKKITLLFFFAVVMMAESTAQNSVVNVSGESAAPFERSVPLLQGDSRTSVSEWYNYGQAIYDMGGSVSYFRNYLFPDSTVVFETATGMSAVWKNSIGQVLDPTSFYLINNTVLDSTINYSLDSVRFWYRYFRFQNAAPDTLVIQIYEHNKLTFAPDPWGTGVPYARAPYNYLTRKGMTPSYEYTYLLTDNDTATDLQNSITLPVNVLVAAGKKIAATITYFPGNPFNAGDTIDAYMATPPANRINAFVAYDFRDNDKVVDALKYNNALTASKEVRYNISTNGWNGKYIPGTAWNAGFYHLDMDFKITTEPASVDGINSPLGSVSVFPNPVLNQLAIGKGHPDVSGAIKEIEIYDVMGNEIGKWQTANGNNKIDVSGLSPGVYFVMLRDEKNNLLRGKFVKM